MNKAVSHRKEKHFDLTSPNNMNETGKSKNKELAFN